MSISMSIYTYDVSVYIILISSCTYPRNIFRVLGPGRRKSHRANSFKTP